MTIRLSALKKCQYQFRLLAKMEVLVDTLYLLAQTKEGQQQFKNKKTTRTDRK